MPKKYYCEVCNYGTDRKSSYEKHIVSAKHHIKTATMIKATHVQTNEDVDTKQLTCIYCSRVLSSIRGKTNHENRCKYKPEDIKDDDIDYDDVKISTTENLDDKVNDVISADLLKSVVEQNAQLIKILSDTKTPTTITNNTTNNSTTNYNNTLNSTNNFNLQVFLNEDCKDAMNLMDFVNSLKYKIEDLEHTGKSGYVEGISKLMIEGLKGLEITQRPIHCTDIKRDTVFVKDNDEWQRDNNKDKLTNAIKYVANNNLKLLPKWTDKNPQHSDLTSETHRKYMKIVSEASGGGTDEEDEKNMKKIIKKVAAETVIDK
jgi:hypothetical protein